MQIGKLNPKSKINFPGFQEILDFTSAGSESSVSVTVDGNTDKEYKVVVRNLATSGSLYCRLNNDSGSNYGRQYIDNTSGSISANRGVVTYMLRCDALTLLDASILTPSGFIKTAFLSIPAYTSGTTMGIYDLVGHVWNSTVNVTTLDFSMSSGNFTSGTRIVVYARRTQ